MALCLGSLSSSHAPLSSAVLSDRNPLVVSRQLLSAFAAGVCRLPAEAHKEVAVFALDKIQPRVVSFEEQYAVLRESVAAVLEAEEAWSAAAAMLAGIDLDSGQRVLDPAYKLATCVKIARLYLEDDDALSAEAFIKRAAFLLPEAPSSGLDLQFKTCYARILDAKRKFLEAARYYYSLSQAVGQGVEDDELLTALNAAVVCTILAAVGPQRTRQLATLFKDERCARLRTHTMLSKVYLGRILRPHEMSAFEAELKPHQLAVGGDGLTVLSRSAIEHNIAAASSLYANISLSEMGTLLGISADKAEKIAAGMIVEGRLRASIDQTDGFVTFEPAEGDASEFDAQITSVSLAVQAVVDALHDKGKMAT